MSESDINERLSSLEDEMKSCRSLIASLKDAIIKAETKLIHTKINYDKLIEEKRLIESRKIDKSTTPRQQEILDFKNKLPDLLKKV